MKIKRTLIILIIIFLMAHPVFQVGSLILHLVKVLKFKKR
jgi:hypothetical protein